MSWIVAVVGLLLVVIILQDAFETLILPRGVARRFRLAQIYYRALWIPWRAVARALPPGQRQESLLGFFGPFSLLMLIALWAASLILGFGLIYLGTGSDVRGPEGTVGVWATFYMSGSTLLTLGFGDVTARDATGRTVAVLEAGTGFGFLALVVGYLPVLYQAFARREVTVSLLDARAGSPPSAAELLSRTGDDAAPAMLVSFLSNWERWAAEVLESHISFPVLAYYRSQHEHQSWLSSLTLALDVCALLLAGGTGMARSQARLTFAMARHTVVDLVQVLGIEPYDTGEDRLPLDQLQHVYRTVAEAHVALDQRDAVDARLRELRALYEPYVAALSDLLLLELPSWCPPAHAQDDWETSAWERSAGAARH